MSPTHHRRKTSYYLNTLSCISSDWRKMRLNAQPLYVCLCMWSSSHGDITGELIVFGTDLWCIDKVKITSQNNAMIDKRRQVHLLLLLLLLLHRRAASLYPGDHHLALFVVVLILVFCQYATILLFNSICWLIMVLMLFLISTWKPSLHI